MFKKTLTSLFFFLTIFSLLGQNKEASIADKINSLVKPEDGKKEKTVLAEVEKKDSIKKVKDSLFLTDTVAYYDSLLSLYAFDKTAEEAASGIDTAAFKKGLLIQQKQMPEKHYSKEKEWQKVYSLSNQISYKKNHIIDSATSIFGWHPYWMGNAYESYNFSLLSSIAYFSYELNPFTGNYSTIHNWRTTALIDSAKAHNCEVLLCVTNFGEKNNRRFLKNIAAQNKFISTITSLLKERDADGVNIDFEGIDSSCRDDFTNFIISVSTSLKTENSKYKVTVALPSVDFGNVFDIPNIKAHVDKFIVMAYEYYGSSSHTAGPISPLSSGNTWMPLDIETSIDQYLIQGLEPSKLILALSYYGAEWETFDLKFPSKSKRFVRYHTYKNIKKITKNYNCIIDEVSFSKAYVYKDKSDNYRQIWFDDSLTLAHKYDFIKEKQIGGVGIWALGYDNGHLELWKLLANKFSITVDKTKEKSKISKFSPRRIMGLAFRLVRNPASVIQRPRSVLMIFGSLFGLAIGGFLLLLRYGTRIKRTFNIAIKGSIAIVVVISFALIFILFKYIGVKEVYFLIGGLLLGLILFYFFSKRFISDKELP